MENQREFDIDLLDLLRYLVKKCWTVILTFVLCGTIGAVFTLNVLDEEYTTEARLYVLNKTATAPGLGAAGMGAATGLAYSDFQIADQLLEDYLILMTGRNVVDEVIATLGLDMTREEFYDKVKAESLNNTRVFQISVTDTDPQRAADIANCIREVASRQIKEIMDVDAVNLVYEADVPEEKSGPSLIRNTAIAAAVGLILAVAVLIVVYLMDDTIRTEEDVEKHLGMSVLGVVPVSEEMADLSKQAAKKKRGKKPSVKLEKK